MNRFVFVRDRKIVAYILAIIVFGIIALIGVTGMLTQAMSNAGLPVNFTGMMIVFAVYATLLYSFILKDCLHIVTFRDNRITFGTFSLMRAYYAQIENVEFDENIIIFYRNKKRKIRVFNIQENRDQYKTLINKLTENSQLNINADSAISSLMKNRQNKYETGGYPLRLGSWLMVLFVSLIISVSANLYLFLISGFLSAFANGMGTNLTLLNTINYLLSIAISVCTIVFMAKRMKKAVVFMKIYYLFNVAVAIVTMVFRYLDQQTSGFDFGFLTIIAPISAFMSYLLVSRYLNISKRVKKTFIYDKFTAISLADREIDPPFKLFSAEPASLYGALSWLGTPILVIIILLVLIVSIVFAAF